MTYTAGQLAADIKLLCKMDIIDIEDGQQDFFIFEQINLFLLKNARTAYLDAWSDSLNVTENGYVTFQLDGSDIADLYEPLMVYSVENDGSMKQIRPMKSFDGGNGWFRAGPNSSIYLRGQTGNVKLHYLRYPKKVTIADDVPEYPPAGYQELVLDVASKVKLVKNYYEESQAVKDQADKTSAVKAAQDARGSSQAPPRDN